MWVKLRDYIISRYMKLSDISHKIQNERSSLVTVSMQEQESNEVVIQVSCSVQCQRNESDCVREIQLDSPIMSDFNSGHFL